MSFAKFSKLIHARFDALSKNARLFVVGNDNRAFEQHYLAAFPPGTNPIYKTNTEHDCSCCKNFIRNLGNVVAIVDGQVETIWDIKGAPHPYGVVAASMDEFVKAQPITNLFATKFNSFGAEFTLQALPGATAMRWNHFHGEVTAQHRNSSPEAVSGAYRTNVETLRRALNELKPAAVSEVLDLIDSKSLYRGEEHKHAVTEFHKLQKAYLKATTSTASERFVWGYANTGAAHFRNSVIGTLVQDLSEGVDVERAVRSFETKVAPTNYKRTTALITPRMVADAMKTIDTLGLEPALHRRFATIRDVSVNNVLWADNSIKGQMKSGIENVLLAAAQKNVGSVDKATSISIDDFMAKVLPTAASMEMLFKGVHVPNLVSLTTSVHLDPGRLFKWDNPFGWSYAGNTTDSIKERVKAAGGNVTNAKLRVSLAWFNYDDLDIHIVEPDDNHIYFGNKSGKLDVDMNAGGGRTRTPVENVSWTSVRDGKYEVLVDCWQKRETQDAGCMIEVESNGQIVQMSYKRPLGKQVPIATLTVRAGVVVHMEPANGVTSGSISQEKWGVNTETFIKVNTLMHSPNYWDGNAVGNKHWFFILDKCVNDEPTRGLYNEFLAPELDKHRKVFEVLGDRTKCQPSEEQLSGLGFSSTRGDAVTVKVADSKTQRIYNITF